MFEKSLFKKSFLSLSVVASMGIGLIACGEEEVPPPPPKVEKSKPKKENKSKFKKMGEEKKNAKSDKKETKAKKNSDSKVTNIDGTDVVKPTWKGSYVLQVGISPSKAQAKKLRDRLRSEGYKHTYLAKVEDPGELEGTFFRVRLGHFKTIPDARVFGSKILKPMGISFWIDNKSNDQVGNPSQDDESDDSDSYQETETYEEPVATPEPAPTPEPEPAPVQQVEQKIEEKAQQKVEQKATQAAAKAEEDWDMPASTNEATNQATNKASEAVSDWDDDGWN